MKKVYPIEIIHVFGPTGTNPMFKLVIVIKMADIQCSFYPIHTLHRYDTSPLSPQASIGIAKLLIMALEEEGATTQEAYSKIWMVDSKGLIVTVR